MKGQQIHSLERQMSSYKKQKLKLQIIYNFINKSIQFFFSQMFNIYWMNLSNLNIQTLNLSSSPSINKDTKLTPQFILIVKERQFQADQILLQKYKSDKIRFYRDQPENQSIDKMEEYYRLSKRVCWPIQQIIHNKITNLSNHSFQYYNEYDIRKLFIRQKVKFHLLVSSLKSIRVQYKLKQCLSDRLQEYHHSISVFDVFKVVQESKQLTEVILKGIQVQHFPQFIHLLNPSNKQQQKEQLSWVRHFSPPKLLKIGIDAKIQLKIENKEQSLSHVKDLMFFIKIFEQVSRQWSEINNWGHTLSESLIVLRQIHQIKLQFCRQGYYQPITAESTAAVRSFLFQTLTSFSQIAHLSFRLIGFCLGTSLNDFLVIEQCLRTIFQNNYIYSLKLHRCYYLPVFPTITTLQSISLNDAQFRKNINILQQLGLTNKCIKSLKCFKMRKSFVIEQETFERLQTLIINQWNAITLNDFTSHSPSQLRHLSISMSNAEIVNVQVLFAKLANITQIFLYRIQFKGEIFATIPSPHLHTLKICDNDLLTNQGLERIDQKWPNIRSITLSDCLNLTESVWRSCPFKGLIEVKLREMIIGEKTIFQLRKRGVKVH